MVVFMPHGAYSVWRCRYGTVAWWQPHTGTRLALRPPDLQNPGKGKVQDPEVSSKVQWHAVDEEQYTKAGPRRPALKCK